MPMMESRIFIFSFVLQSVTYLTSGRHRYMMPDFNIDGLVLFNEQQDLWTLT